MTMYTRYHDFAKVRDEFRLVGMFRAKPDFAENFVVFLQMRIAPMKVDPERLQAHFEKTIAAGAVEHYDEGKIAADGDIVVTIAREKERSMVHLMVVEMQLLVVIPYVGSSDIELG